MKIKVIKTEKEYNEACEYIYNLIHSSENEISPGSKEGEEIELLSLLVDDYEKRMGYKLASPDPIEAIKIKMDQKKLKQKDLIPYIGSKSTVSKVLKKQRALSLEMIKNISKYLDIPVNILVGV